MNINQELQSVLQIKFFNLIKHLLPIFLKQFTKTILPAFLFHGFLFSQTNLTVMPNDPAYFYLNDLRAWGLINSEISGTRPYTRLHFSRLILEAKSNLQEMEKNTSSKFLHGSIDYLTNRFAGVVEIGKDENSGEKTQIRLIDWLSFSYLNYAGGDRALPFFRLDANVNPFTAYRESRKLAEGQNFALESSHSLVFGKTVSLHFHGRYAFIDPRSSSSIDQGSYFETLRAYLHFSFWNFNLLIGKDSVIWGTGSRGNLILSQNVKPPGSLNSLPLIKLTNNLPVRMPWIFRHLGPMRYTFFLTRLEKKRADFAHPVFGGSRANFKISNSFEFGFGHALIMGGNNFPIDYTFIDGLAEFFFIRTKQNLLFNIEIGERVKNGNIANHMGLFDFRLRLAGLRNTEFYGEIAANDIQFDLNKFFSEDPGFYGGIFIPRLTADGRWKLRLEYTRTAAIFYPGSRPFDAGFTYNRRILGSDLGPAGNEIFIQTTFRPVLKTTITTFADFQTSDYDKRITDVSSGLKTEKRLQIGNRLSFQLASKIFFHLETRYQRITAFAYQPDDDRNAYFFGTTFQIADLVNLTN